MRYSKARLRRKFSNGMQDVSLTPLIDTALTLLIIFMVATPMMHNAIRVNLPRGGTKESGTPAQQEFIVYIDQDKNLFFNGIPVTENNLINTIQQALGPKKEQTVFVRGDMAVPYGEVMEIVRKISPMEGIKHVALATKRA